MSVFPVSIFRRGRDKVQRFLPLILIFFIVPFIGIAAQTDDSSTLRQYEKFELQFEVAGDYTNPYDPRQVDVTAVFTAPNGDTFQTHGFYTDSGWFVRFTPTEVGNWSYEIHVRFLEGTPQTIETGEFSVEANEAHKGFIRPSGRYFAFDNGDTFFPIGQNLGWASDETGGLDLYLQWLDDLAASGANYARLNIDTAWFIGLDWAGDAGDYSADQPDAAWLDEIIEAAEARGIYLQLVLNYHRSFTQYRGLPVTPPENDLRPDTSADFDSHPYNQINGGPMAQESSFFSDVEVRRLLRQKLRYIVARWGYSPNIFAWEVLTDADRLTGYNAERADIILSLADYLHEIDLYAHPVTIGTSELLPEIIGSNTIDFIQIHSYQSRPIEDAQDQATLIQNQIAEARNQTEKPVLLSEFSLSAWFEPLEDDPNGLHLRNTLWSSAFSGAAGSGMTWWWDTYIAPQNLYSLYTPLARFAEGVNWQNTELIVPALNGDNATYTPLRIDDFNTSSNYISPPDKIYLLTGDGAVPPASNLSNRIYGTRSNILGNRPQTFILTAPTATTLTIAIENVAQNAVLQIILDNQIYTTLEVSSSTSINVPLSGGEHRLTLDNLGEGWIEFDYIEIQAYVTPLRVQALADRTNGVALAWIHHRDFTWQNTSEITAETYYLLLPNLPEGVYQVEFWDTLTGNVLGQELLSTQNGSLQIALLPITSDLAIRAVRIEVVESDTVPLTPIATRTPLISLTPTASSTPTFTPSLTATYTATMTPTFTTTASLTATLTPSSTTTPTNTPSSTASMTVTATSSATPSATHTVTSTQTVTTTVENTDLPTATDTPTLRPSTTPQTSPTVTPSVTPQSNIPRQTRTPRP